MANLRTNNLSGEQGQNAYRGSVQFLGGNDALVIPASSDFAYGTGDFTIEAWIWKAGIPEVGETRGIFTQTQSGNDYIVFKVGSTNIIQATFGSTTISTTDKLAVRSWNHVAVSRSSNTVKVFLNGIASSGSTVSTDFSDTTRNPTIGNYTHSYGSLDYNGFISNLRVTKGEALYTADFTPPTTELTADANTVLLCCQNSDDPTQEETGKTITASGNLATTSFVKQQPKVIPPYGVDAGNTFGGPIQQSTQGYMYFPTGRTEERGRGRGLFNGGGGPINTIQYIQIQSQGNANDFGDLTSARDLMGSAASSVRGLFAGAGTPTFVNTIDFVTIATTSNAIDFGDLVAANYTPGALASNIRAVFGGGSTPGDPNTNVMQFVTIATTGDTSDFGDLTVGRRHVGGLSSPTRGVYGAGANPGITDVMDFITIASTGNATDFGNMTVSRNDTAGCSNANRGLFIGGLQPSLLNTIDFITIATTGNAQEFGDLVNTVRYGAGLSNSTRGVFMPGNNATARNTIDFVIIDTTGNAQDFGDLLTGINYPSACSDSHGGLAV